MGDDDKRKFEPGATMQIDLDQVQLVDLEAAAKSRKVPPPLPPLPPEATQPAETPSQARPSAAPRVASVAPRPPSIAAPPESRARNLMHIGIIVVVVAVAIAAGLAVGRGVGGTAAATPSASAASAAAPVARPAVAPSAVPSGAVLELPPFEVK
jgi:hypothetical protein